MKRIESLIADKSKKHRKSVKACEDNILIQFILKVLEHAL